MEAGVRWRSVAFGLVFGLAFGSVFSFSPVVQAGGGRLDDVRAATGASSGGRSWGDDDDDDDDGAADVAFGIIGALLASGDDDETQLSFDVPRDESRSFLPYPYAGGRDGYHVRAAPGEKVNTGRSVAFHMAGEGAFLYQDVWRGSLNLRLLFPRFYMEARYDHLLEGPRARLDGDLEVSGTVRDRLHFVTLGTGFQMAPGEMLAVRLGPTFMAMFDTPKSGPSEPTHSLGGGAAVEVDLYPVRPLVLSGRGAISRLGGAVMMEGRATVGVTWNRIEVFAGYDHRRVGNVPLGGPVLGLRARF